MRLEFLSHPTSQCKRSNVKCQSFSVVFQKSDSRCMHMNFDLMHLNCLPIETCRLITSTLHIFISLWFIRFYRLHTLTVFTLFRARWISICVKHQPYEFPIGTWAGIPGFIFYLRGEPVVEFLPNRYINWLLWNRCRNGWYGWNKIGKRPHIYIHVFHTIYMLGINRYTLTMAVSIF